MGKRLIIKGADFSANGMKVVNYQSYIYSKKKYQSSADFNNSAMNIVGDGCPITEFSGFTGKITIVAYLQGVSTEYGLMAGTIASGNTRLNVGKSYEANSNHSPFKIMVQFGSGSYEGSTTIENGEHTIVLDSKKVYVDGVEVPVTGSVSASNYLFNKIVLFGEFNTASQPQAKYKRITFEQGGSVVADYRAAKDESGVACMYEEVSKTYVHGENFYAE